MTGQARRLLAAIPPTGVDVLKLPALTGLPAVTVTYRLLELRAHRLVHVDRGVVRLTTDGAHARGAA